jgi:HNH endonuclease
MRARIGGYRRAPIGVGEDPVIGCLFVRDVRFFPAGAIADPPPQFARNIVQGKSYDMADPAVAGYFADVLRLTLGAAVELDFCQPWHRSGPVFGDPRLAPYRLGQQSFKVVVLNSYHRRCAISGTHIPPVLQAAHIRPVAKGGEHRLDKGLLLRSDVHALFDRGTSTWTRSTACWSAPDCGRTSATATSSTPRRVRSSTCRNAAPTGPARRSWNGTSTRSSSRQPQLDQALTRCGGHARDLGWR